MASVSSNYGIRQPAPKSASALWRVPALADSIKVKVTSEELIGIEIEVENFTRQQGSEINPVWGNTSDGSLRNNGIEFVSKPIKAVDAPVALAHLLQAVLTQDCCFSPRTSVHVHLNACDLEIAQVANLVSIYTIFEIAMYKFCGRGRMKNIYCVPLVDTGLLQKYTITNPAQGWRKYTGLNLIPLAEKGTLEFRHMHGTFDVEKLCIWINMITSLKDFVKRTDLAELRTMVAALQPGDSVDELATKVFGEFAKHLDLKEVSLMEAKTVFRNRDYETSCRRNFKQTASFFQFKGN